MSIDLGRVIFWASYSVLFVGAAIYLTGCIQPASMYGNVYQCPTDLLTNIQTQLQECAQHDPK